MIKTENEAIAALNSFSCALSRVKLSNKLNIFDAVGMATQEVKHSAFLAWLLDPKQTHGLGDVFLLDFLNALWNYSSEIKNQSVPLNSVILSEKFTLDDMKHFAEAQDIEVKTEKVVTNPESRIDIFIQSKAEKTTLVIENKVFTSTHDDQLRRYENEVEIFDGEKIFVYLTPNGDLPTAINGEYQTGWCIFGYSEVLSLLKSRLAAIPKTKQYAKLRFLTEDYIEMVDDKILHNNPTIRSLCKEIRRNHADALEILLNYTDNAGDVYRHIAEKWLPLNIPAPAKNIYGGRKLVFYTPSIANFYARHGQSMEVSDGLFRFQISVASKDGPISIGMWLAKNSDDAWSDADIKLRDILQPNKKMGDKYCTLYSVELLNEEEREKSLDGSLIEKLEDRLTVFLNKLQDLEIALDKA